MFCRGQVVRKYSCLPNFPKCDFTPKKYKGLAYEKLKKIRKTNLNPILTTFYQEPLAIHQGYRQWLFDIRGKRYLDLFGGICTVSIGHCHPKITQAVTEQMETLCHISNVYFHSKIHEYAERLADMMPGNLKVVFFVNSGSEANDMALLMTRAYTGRETIISLRNCYHGMTFGTMGLTSDAFYKYPISSPAGMLTTMNPDVYRGIWGGNKCRDSPVQTDRHCSCTGECEAGIRYVEQFKQEFLHNIPKNGLAGFWAETIQGVAGTVQYPKNYIKTVREIVKQHGGLFVSDEVQTGFGRTGDNFWGFEMHEIIPDIVILAKGIGNGFPLAAVVTTKEIANALMKGGYFSTFGGNPVACSVGLSVLDVIKEEKLQENSKEVGTYMLLKLADLKSKYPIFGDVRGKGLMIGVDLVENPETREPVDAAKFLKFWEYCKEAGIIVGKGGIYDNVLRIKPPMCITKEDVDFAISVLEEAAKNL